MKTFAKILTVLFGIFMVVTGVICLFTPITTSLTLGYAIGIVMICDAISAFMAWWDGRKDGSADGWTLAGSVLSLVLGILIISNIALALSLDVFIVYYVAAWLVFHGIFSICHAFRIHKLKKAGDTSIMIHWYIPLLTGILTIAFGVLCMFKPLIMASIIGVFVGLGIIAAGCSIITMASSAPKD